METLRHLFCILAGIFLAGLPVLAADNPAHPVVSAPSVYVPDISHANQPIPPGVLAWDQTTKSADAADGQSKVQFVFNFTNIAQKVDRTLTTNITQIPNVIAVTNKIFWHKRVSYTTNYTAVTNITWVTNSTPIPITILNVRPGCHCTTAQLPPTPWTLAPGANGQIHLTVDIIRGQTGMLFKSVNVSTDKGYINLFLRVNILPPVIPTLSEAERARDIAVARIDRQAVFRGDCAKCHANNIAGKYGQALYDSACAICHDAKQRASIVPDLHALKTPTNPEFWRIWIASGKPGSLMPAFANSQGGPLSDMQVFSLAGYLNAAIPSRVQSLPAGNMPAK